jgi:Flp pilus assembly protein TadG
MRTTLANQKGAVLIIFAFLLLVLIGFAALATEAGRWYMVRSELSKAVDAAAFAGAKNISNPYLTPAQILILAQDFGKENFPSGYAGTPGTGATAVAFTAVELSDHRIQVTGSVTSPAYLAQLFGVNQVATSAAGVAKKNNVEIMLVLDKSGSMAGTPIADLKTAATSFIGYFQTTQAEDKVGLISFATTATVDVALGYNYVNPMTTKINAMTAFGATNAEDALAQSYGPGGLSDQTGVPGSQRVQQFVIFFTDGMPTALRDRFKYNNTDYDGVAYGVGYSGHANCKTTDYAYMSVWDALQTPTSSSSNPSYYPGVDPATTGDGKGTSNPNRTSCRSGGSYYLNTKWYLFETTSPGPVPGYTAESCSIPMNRLLPYFCDAARQLALDHAQELKNRFVKIYIIGLGGVDKAFLHQIASGDAFEYYAPSSSDLQAMFNMIAKDIKLRLVQ